MKKYIFILLLILNATTLTFSQEGGGCGTPTKTDEEMEELPWFGNNAYLDELADELGLFEEIAYKSESDVVSSKYKIPIQFWVYRSSGGHDDGLNEVYIQKQLDGLNKIFKDNSSQISFYRTCDIEYIDNDKYLYLSGLNQIGVVNSNHEKGVINVHVVRDMENNGVYVPLGIKDGVIIKKNAESSTLAHEIGHFFSLAHTHRNNDKSYCRKESVSRTYQIPMQCGCVGHCTNCERRGDGLCDTPADPGLDNWSLVSGCSFNNTTLTDPHGDTYISNPPDTRNIMSYMNPRSCRDHFSHGQITAMVSNIVKRGWSHDQFYHPVARYLFDRFEPDNYSTTARNIDFSEVQHHTFHWSKEKKGEVRTCDGDWVSFLVPPSKQGKPIAIITDKGVYEDANTEIYLYKESDLVNPIAYDDNSNGNGYSKIILENPSAGKYYALVRYLSSPSYNTVSDYILELRECLPTFYCANGIVNSGEDKKYYAQSTLTSPCPGLSFVMNPTSQVELVSERKIDLKEGFDSKSGSFLYAHISEIGEEACLNNSSNGKRSFKTTASINENSGESILNTSEQTETNLENTFDQKIMEETMVIFPNPALEQVNIKLNGIKGGELSLISVCGNILQFQEVQTPGLIKLNLTSLPKGFYLVQFTSNSGKRLIKNLIVK